MTKQTKKYYHKKWRWYYPLKNWLGYAVIKYNYYMDGNEYRTYGPMESNLMGVSNFRKVSTTTKVKWAMEVLLNPKQWRLKYIAHVEYKKKVKEEVESQNDLCDLEKKNNKVVNDKKPKEKELNKWHEENQELPELDDYSRRHNWSWNEANYQQKLKVYSLLTGVHFDGVVILDPWEAIKPKLGRHNFYQFMYDKYSKEEEWKKTQNNLINIYKKH